MARLRIKTLRMVCVALAFVLLSCLILYPLGSEHFERPGPLTEDTQIIIPRGMSFQAIARTLEEQGVVGSASLFAVEARIYYPAGTGNAKAGEYAFSAGISPKTVMEKLTKGDMLIHSITLPEGWTVTELRARLQADDRLTGELPAAIPEGSLLPETYHFLRGESRAVLVSRMQKAMQETLMEGWESRDADLPLTSPEQAVILASIVERETGVDAERNRVAAVFYNRLRAGMRLQSDPTVIYGIELEEGPLKRPLWRNDLMRDHPYNTYLYNGLPAGPIANPGRASLEAVFHPLETDELYFVATGKGGHHFARNLKEHNDNVARYRKQLQEP